MSNPSVITLGATNDGRFRVEDNIGEAIHIHWNSIRVDLTCSEFEQLDEQLESIFYALSDECFFKEFDWYFLYLFANQLSAVSKCEERNITLSALLVRNSIDSSLNPISKSEVYNMLVQNAELNSHNLMVPPTSESELHRTTTLKEIYLKHSTPKVFESIVVTPYRGKYLVLDGQHRASILYYFNEKYVPAKILTFKKPSLLKKSLYFLRKAYRLKRKLRAVVLKKTAILKYKFGGSAKV